MNIFLLYETTDSPWGGINTFFRNFSKCAKKDANVELTKTPDTADIVLTAGHYCGPGREMRRFQLRNVAAGRPVNSILGLFSGKHKTKVVFRVDGLKRVYTGSPSGADAKLIRNLSVADAIIFQSEFSRVCFQDSLIGFPTVNTVVLNGADQDLFRPVHSTITNTDTIRLVSSSWSTNRYKGFATIASFSELEHVEVQHIGRWLNTIDPKSVKLLGTKTETEIAEIMQTAHFLLFPSEYEACPNTVLESLASGIPVLYHDSGGTSELCQGERYGRPIPDDPAEFCSFLQQVRSDYSRLRNNILTDIQNFSFKRCYNEYISFFKRIYSGQGKRI